MIKKFKIVFMMMLCLVFANTVAFASGDNSSSSDALSEVKRMDGQITEINGNMITVQSKEDANQRVALIVRWDTEILNGKNGEDVELSRLNVGDELTAYYSPIATRSIPSQSKAFALIMGNAEYDAIYMKVAEVTQTKQGTRILNTNGDIYVTIPKDIDGNFKDLKKGDSILVWYYFMAMSMPAQATALKAEIL